MKVLSSSKFGASHQVLKRFYLAYSRYKIAYCSSFLSTAAKTHIAELLPIQNSALRLILEARKTTLILSLEAEANVPPLDHYLDSINATFYIKLHFQGEDSILAKDVLGNPHSSFSRAACVALSNYGVHHIPKVPNNVFSHLPPWGSLQYFLVMTLPEKYHSNHAFSTYVREHYPGYITIFTYGSKTTTNLPSVASGIYVPSRNAAHSCLHE